MKQIVRRLVFIMVVALVALQTQAQERPKKFDPARFEADLEQFITTEAGLNPYQAAKFFPLYREMQKKQRQLFNEMRQLHKVDRNNDKACAEAIEKMDNIDLRIKKLQKYYHGKFMAVLPAGKVMDIIRAEDKFHRQAFRKAANRHDKR